MRDYDCVGRYGGEEFLVIAPAHADKAMTAVRAVARRWPPPRSIPRPGAVSITVSIGVATGTGQSTVDGLLAAADAALYQAKADGRNRVVHSVMHDPGNEGKK